jgi:acetyl-CoA acetyltransferase
MTRFEHDSVISGVGQSTIARRLGLSAIELTAQSCLAAIADAGLTTADIDGLSTYPGGDAAATLGYGGPPPDAVQDALRLSLNWYQGSAELPGQLGSLVAAAMAISAGLCRHVLVYRTVTESSAQGARGRGAVLPSSASEVSGLNYWTAAFGAVSAVNWLAPLATRYFHEFGVTREQLGAVAVTQRSYAQHNPRAPLQTPLTLDDYLAARMISTPLCLLDCDLPVDGSTAFVLSHASCARDRPNPPVFIDAVGTAMRGRPSWDQYDDLTAMAATGAGAHLWERSSLRPADVDAAQLYDGFSILVLVWLEALGFCPRGGAAEFAAAGELSAGGRLPTNTFGGQLSAGRLHGFGHLHEACTQIRGTAGERQMAPAPKVVAVANGGGPIAGCMLLTAESPR